MSEIPDELSAVLADSYSVEGVIGRGGMATVYVARDLKHHRQVAVKVLRPELAEILGTERFLREIEIAAALNHPHILPLHDSGDADGMMYYVMPFVDGSSLRDLMNREGKLDSTRALALIREVGGALTYAHRRGVVHRDIKPENILLSEGQAVVADFGIARAISTAGGKNLTRTGFPLGTPGYMSPEQAAGLTDLDNTTDVFSLACVFYEMAIGEPPGLWPMEESLRLGRFMDAAPGHRAILDGMPGRVERTLVRAMSIRPADRFQTPDEMSEALHAAYENRPYYGETEAKEIVRRAADLQAEYPTATGALSVGGIEQIAAEVGIEPQFVDRAIQSREPVAAPAKADPFLGGPTTLSLERLVEGEIPESEYPEVIETIRLAINNRGEFTTMDKTLGWHTRKHEWGREVHVTITPRGGQTRIRIREKLTNLALMLYPGILGGVGLGGGALVYGLGLVAGLPDLAALAGWGLTFFGSYLPTRKIFNGRGRKHEEELTRLIDELAAHAQRSVSPPPQLPRLVEQKDILKDV